MKHEKILNSIVEQIEKHLSDFSSGLSLVEKGVYERILELTQKLEVKNGKITQSVQNINLIRDLSSDLQRMILSPTYMGHVEEFSKAFEIVQGLQNSYFSSLSVDFKPKKLLTALKNDAVNYTIDQLTDQGVSSLVASEAEAILRQNITQGGSIGDLIDQMKQFIRGGVDAEGNKIPGRLTRYASQITTDSLNQFSANYNEAATADLGWKWRMYTGSLLETSREWCVYMVKKKYVHQSELQTVIQDHIDGVQICSQLIPCSKKTGLPKGMIAGTNASNVGQRRGGWQCGHQFGGVPDAVVPLNLRNKIKS